MEQKAFIVTDLSYGDVGKGTVTHWLSSLHKAHTVIRTGGPQALHRVVTTGGAEHVFSQFGSGTLRGSATHLSSQMIIDPHAILKEGEHLKYVQGIHNIFDLLTIHEDAIVITPFQAIAGRLRELLRGKNRHGSVGIGVGETVLDAETLGDLAIRAKDLMGSHLREKLHIIRQHKLVAFEEVRDRASFIPLEVRESVRAEIAELEDLDTLEWAVERFTELVKRVRIVDTEYVSRNILNVPGTVIFEGSQGVLLDRFLGFHPYTTKVRTTTSTAFDLLKECAYTGDVKSFGVLRAYHTRHGAGPFVTESQSLTEQLPDATNKDHPWQGSFRVGSFDAVAARYALEAAGRTLIDGLVITCLDRLQRHKIWEVCNAYTPLNQISEAQSFFQYDGNNIINIATGTVLENGQRLERQAELGKLLYRCIPKNTAFDISSEPKQFLSLCV
ncbi:MAG: adenylosuccinate synthetase, partial [Patescibacteria group bacterium]